MAVVITKKVKVDSQFKMVKLQFLLHCYFTGINLSDADLDCLTTVAINGYSKETIKKVIDTKIFKSEQTVRNCIGKLTNLGLLVKVQRSGRQINPDLKIGIDDTIIMDAKVANVS
jgi:predicted transcriptional regulator